MSLHEPTGLPSAPRLAAALVLAALILAWPAIWNGFPLVFADTAGNIGIRDPRLAHFARPIFYGLFTAPFVWTGTLWTVVFAQGLLLAYVIWLTQRVVVGRPTLAGYALTILVVALGTALPWTAAQILPDVLTPVAVLACFLLGFGHDRLSPLERVVVALLLAVAVASHLSHVPLVAGLALAIFLFRLMMPSIAPGMPALRPLQRTRPVLMVGAALGVAVAAHIGVNAVALGKAALTPFSSIPLLARSLDDGPATATLKASCPDSGWRLCAYADRLPMNFDLFLWPPDGPFNRMIGADRDIGNVAAGRIDYQDEARAILDATFQQHPLWQAKAALLNTARQLARARTVDMLPPYGPAVRVSRVIAEHVPGDVPRYYNSRQQRGLLDGSLINRLHALLLPVLAAVAVTCALLVPENRRLGALLAVFALAFLANAFITGALSGPHHRYQGRVIGLIGVAAGIGMSAVGPAALRVHLSDPLLRRGGRRAQASRAA